MRDETGSTCGRLACGFGCDRLCWLLGSDWRGTRRFSRYLRRFAHRFSGGLLLLRCFFLSYLLLVVFVDDAGHVGMGLAIGRQAAVLLDPLRPSVVGS